MKKLKRTVGKQLCRLFGDEVGGVMMEYVILAVLIAAAVVVAVAMFGKTLVGMFEVAADGATGSEKKAFAKSQATKAETDANAKKAAAYHESMHEPN